MRLEEYRAIESMLRGPSFQYFKDWLADRYEGYSVDIDGEFLDVLDVLNRPILMGKRSETRDLISDFTKHIKEIEKDGV